MSHRRKLTDDEKLVVEAWALNRERPKYPGADVTIDVQDDVDEGGNVHYITLAIAETAVQLSQVMN